MSTTPDPSAAFGFGTPWAAQIDFLKRKLNLPTERWNDITRSAHDRAFIVAGAQKADLLNDMHAAVVKAAEGGSLRGFQKDFPAIVAKHGWTGWTGEGTAEGEAWRTKIIYTTNMSTSYAAGRYKYLTDPESLAAMPYWRYIHADGILNPRQQHVDWHGLTLPHDHPFWVSHFPPNGFNCHCRITAVSRAEGLRSKAAGLGEPPAGWDKIDTGTLEPNGIGKGFGYAPGANTDTSLRELVQKKLIAYPDAIATALSRDVGRYINATADIPGYVRAVVADKQRNDPLWLGFVENFEQVNAVVTTDTKGYLLLLPADAPRHVANAHSFDGGTQRPATPSDYAQLAFVLAHPDSLVAGDVVRVMERIVVKKIINGDIFHAVFEVRPGKNNKALALVTLVVKTTQ